MNKICTSIEQSKKLIELGIDVNTADFMWEYDCDKEIYWDKPTIIPIDDYIFINDIPAWSLAALLDILPKNLDIGRPVLATNYRGYYWVSYFDEYMKENKFTSKIYNNPIDACYEMVLELHRQKLL